MELEEKIITKRRRSKREQKEYLQTLLNPIMVSIITSLLIGLFLFFMNNAKGETRLEKLEEKTNYILQRVDNIYERLITPPK